MTSCRKSLKCFLSRATGIISAMNPRVLFLCLVLTCGYLPISLMAQTDTTYSVSDSVGDSKKARKGSGSHKRMVFVDSTNRVEQIHTTDSALRKKHSPKIAVALSAVIPGAGQIYNKKAWKIPIIYAGLAASTYYVVHFAKETNIYKYEYRYRMQGKTDLLNPQLATKDDETILSLKSLNQRRMEVSIAATAVVYALNLIDALVDAHLFYFDISDNLSMQWVPSILPNSCGQYNSYGVTLSLSFK